MNDRYIWQFTAEEWLGPRIRGTPVDQNYAKGQRIAGMRQTTGVRVQVGDVWAEHSYWGSVIFDAPSGGRLIGTLEADGLSTIDPEFVGRGIATRVAVDGLLRMAKTNSTGYMKSRFESVTVAGEKFTARLYAETIKQAVVLGHTVEKKVLDSAAEVTKRYEALRRGDDSALQLLPEKERRRKERRNTSSRYRWVRVRSSFMDWLAASGKPLSVKSFEKLVVVSDE